jgi:hypothetical protein
MNVSSQSQVLLKYERVTSYIYYELGRGEMEEAHEPKRWGPKSEYKYSDSPKAIPPSP